MPKSIATDTKIIPNSLFVVILDIEVPSTDIQNTILAGFNPIIIPFLNSLKRESFFESESLIHKEFDCIDCQPK